MSNEPKNLTWEDVTINQVFRLKNLVPELSEMERAAGMVSIMFDIRYTDVMKMPIKKIQDHLSRLGFLASEMPSVDIEEFDFDGSHFWIINGFHDECFAKWIALENSGILSENFDPEKTYSAALLASFLVREKVGGTMEKPILEPIFDERLILERAKRFHKLPAIYYFCIARFYFAELNKLYESFPILFPKEEADEKKTINTRKRKRAFFKSWGG